MGFKVGDMVIYKNQTVRVLKVGGIYLTLSGFGKVNTKKEQVKFLESVQLPRIKKGYWVIVRDIPENEKQRYGAIWLDEMDNYVDKTFKVRQVRHHPALGTMVRIGEWWFQAYHLELAPTNIFKLKN